ncbi:MAG: glycoside hydrolase family 5 protein [Dehalococcoidia bacterium]|nr:glycoside hydrolase family 5 protein [Dehalococcoidia bacterium]
MRSTSFGRWWTAAHFSRLVRVAAAIALSIGALRDDSHNAHAAGIGLRTDGPHIVDADGSRVIIRAVNWYGFEGPDFLPSGLNIRSYRDILWQVREMGFNTIRLPFSNELIARNLRIDSNLEANRELMGRTSLEIMDAIISHAADTGLWIILDNHSSSADRDEPNYSGLWYTPQYPHFLWLQHWRYLAARYSSSPNVIGFDLRNEPHTAGTGLSSMDAYLYHGVTWGTGDPATDWRMAAEQAGNAVLSVNPSLLIFVEGVQLYPDGSDGVYDFWWGGNLRGVAQHPVRLNIPNRLVYSTHDYGPDLYRQPWHNDTATYESMSDVWHGYWGYIMDPGSPYTAPVFVGEFGTCNTAPSCVADDSPGSQGQWFSYLARYIKERGAGWSYWPLNGTYPTVNGAAYGAPEFYGLLSSQWSRPALPAMMQVLRPLLSNR